MDQLKNLKKFLLKITEKKYRKPPRIRWDR